MGLFRKFKGESYNEVFNDTPETPEGHAESYSDYPDFGGMRFCPQCSTEIGYSYGLSEFKCPSCGMIVEENDREEYEDIYEDLDNDEPPRGCNLFSDD